MNCYVKRAGSRQASYTSHMSRMSYNSHGDLLNGKPPAMSGGGGKDYRSANRVAGNASASRPTLVPDLVVEHSRHHYYQHHHNQNHDYVSYSHVLSVPFIIINDRYIPTGSQSGGGRQSVHRAEERRRRYER